MPLPKRDIFGGIFAVVLDSKKPIINEFEEQQFSFR